MSTDWPAPSDVLYRALSARDARFDGRFLVGVTSTGIYCRPICRVRTPLPENCRFFRWAAQAEHAGFRPCLRCRPELAPTDRHWSHEDAGQQVFHHALRMLDLALLDPTRHPSNTLLPQLSARLGISDRHLRRVFDRHMGVSPLQYLLTRKLLMAKQLLTDTRLPVAEVAHAAGFGSQRRLQAAFVQRYGLSPSRLRPRASPPSPLGPGARPPPPATHTEPAADPTVLRLSWRPPYQAAALVGFWAQRAIPGLEVVDTTALRLTRSLRLPHGEAERRGWLALQWRPQAHAVEVGVSASLIPVLPAVLATVRAALDLDTDPAAIDVVLHTRFPQGDGMRVPGAFDGFEMAVRAVLGQQISLSAARRLLQRLVDGCGEPLETPWAGVHRLFPSPAGLLTTSAEQLGAMGIIRQRQAALRAIAQAVLDGALDLRPGADPERTVAQLVALPGVGPWTAQVIAMRALGWPDAWPQGDVALTQALGLPDHRSATAHRLAQQAAERWRPWRSYAVVRAWAGAHHTPETPT